jgi:hypothetical protein
MKPPMQWQAQLILARATRSRETENLPVANLAEDFEPGLRAGWRVDDLGAPNAAQGAFELDPDG